MKTKNKILALVEITIVLCSVFLMALPVMGIAADKTTPQVSASEVTTASEDEFILEIYGNANEDDTIDMRDYTYTARIICWLEEETDLADANYDGRISVADMTQIGLIILGRESELTIIDGCGKSKTFYLPITRIIAADDGQGVMLRVFGIEDLVVGVGGGLLHSATILPEMSKQPIIGTAGPGGIGTIDYEKVLTLEPDIFFTYIHTPPQEELEEILEPHGIQVLRLEFGTVSEIAQDMKKLGYLLGKQDKAEEFIDWYEEYLSTIKSRTEGLSEDEKSQVFIEFAYLEGGWTCSKGSSLDERCTMAGGVKIAHDLVGSGLWLEFPVVEPEWVLEHNPDIVIRPTFGGDWGYETDDPSEMEAVREETMKRPGWRDITAVKDGDIYIVSGDIVWTLHMVVMVPYMAKWFHPELFDDLDPEAIHQEFIDEFLRIDYDLDEHGVFVYPPLE